MAPIAWLVVTECRGQSIATLDAMRMTIGNEQPLPAGDGIEFSCLPGESVPGS
jgi:hypothetical protein